MSVINQLSDRGRIEEALDRMQENTNVVWKGGDWTCCQTCGSYDLAQEGHEHYVFWHQQTDERTFGIETKEYYETEEEDLDTGEMYTVTEVEYETEITDDMQASLMLYHSDLYAAGEAVRYLREAGFEIDWNGTESMAIEVKKS